MEDYIKEAHYNICNWAISYPVEDYEEKWRAYVKEQLDALLTEARKKWLEEVGGKVSMLIRCNRCNGVGGYLGSSLGYCECEDCGGDGHSLYGHDGDTLANIISRLEAELKALDK